MGEIQAAESIGLRRTWRLAAGPSDGPTGTLAAVANIGDLLVDTSNKKLYMNKGTKASPTWTELIGAGVAIDTEVANMTTPGTSTANAIGSGPLAAPVDHVHKIGDHDHSDSTKGNLIGPTAFASDAFTADVTGRAPFQDGIINTAKLADDALAAGATGRAKMADNFFDAATAALKFESSSIPNDKVNWSFGAAPTAETPDVAGNAGSNTTISRSDHVHQATCDAPSGYTLAAADAEGGASTFARSNHVHKAILDNQVYFVGRNVGDSGDINMIKINAADLVEFGASLAATTLGATLTAAAQQISFSTGNITFSGNGYVAIGASPADGGAGLRVPNNVYAVYARNTASNGNINMWKVNASDLIEAGVSLAALTMAGQLSMADQILDFTSGYIELGTAPAQSGIIRVENDTPAWVARNVAPDADIDGWKVNTADDYEASADVNLGGNTLYGDTAANGDLTLVATTSGTKTSALIIASQHLDATADGVATFVKAAVSIGDADFVVTPENGTLAIASDNGRIYYRYGDSWSYVAKTGGFEIPKDETVCPNCKKALKVGQAVMGELNEVMGDGALHGLWRHTKC